MQPIPSVQNVDFQQFHNEIVTANQPVVIKSVVADWPSVKAAQQSPKAIVDYLKAFDIDAIVSALVGKPDINGRFFYTDDLTDLNFQRT